MKPCKGCKHLVNDLRTCNAIDNWVFYVDPLTGAKKSVNKGLMRGQLFYNSPEAMRSKIGKCGPERNLFKPCLLFRIAPWLY